MSEIEPGHEEGELVAVAVARPKRRHRPRGPGVPTSGNVAVHLGAPGHADQRHSYPWSGFGVSTRAGSGL